MLSLHVRGAAALVGSGAEPAAFGAVAPVDSVPKGVRRKLSAFDMGVARCVIGLSAGASPAELVFASRYGNMAVTLELLTALVERELLSPARFSSSVHNAAVGMASQMTANRRAHTAVAAGENTLAAGLTEAWTRLKEGAGDVMLVYADAPLPEVYGAHDEGPAGVGVWLAMTVCEPAAAGRVAVAVRPGRAGAAELARAELCGRSIAWAP